MEEIHVQVIDLKKMQPVTFYRKRFKKATCQEKICLTIAAMI